MLRALAQGGGTLMVCPSISFPEVELRKITGIQHYEERMLFLLLLMSNPSLRVVYVSSMPIDPAIVDYYLSFLEDPEDARSRLRLAPLNDPTPSALTAKILEDEEMIETLRSLTGETEESLIVPFNVTRWESDLAETLDVPLYGTHPGLNPLGSKSGSRRIARLAEVPTFDGAEDLWSLEEIESAAFELLERRAGLEAFVVKLNNGFSGQGNAILRTSKLGSPLRSSETTFCAEGESWDSFGRKVAAEGAVIEELSRRAGAASPSVQMSVAPGGNVEVVSTHDQILGGPDDQVYLGCRFPARASTEI